MIIHGRPKHELAHVIDAFLPSFKEQHHPNGHVLRTLDALRSCRTATLGGHVDRCDDCGHVQISYNSCRNRHCPKCQNTQRETWIENRKADLLPVPYFHVVFTVPDLLNGLFIHNPTGMYNLLLKSAWDTINQLSLTKRNIDTGMIAVLHTWGQTLSLHPHVHCIVPGGGVNIKGSWQGVPQSANGKAFLFPVKQMSAIFRGKMIDGLRSFSSIDKALYKNPWVVYAKEPFAGPEQVIEYLGRYTHKVAISNHRLKEVSDKEVRFAYKDYRDGKQKQMSLSGVEFLRRFSLHILPSRFVRIRHYGLLSSTRKPELRRIQQAFGLAVTHEKTKKDWKTICKEHLDYDPECCPKCKKGKMITLERWLPGRDPPPFVAKLKTKIS